MRTGSCFRLGLALACVFATACGTEEATCPTVEGSYQPLYIPITGSCGTIEQPNSVPFDGGRQGVNMSIENRVNSRITTYIVMKGCTVRMTQTVTDNSGRVASQIDGETIEIESKTLLTGQVSMTIFDDGGDVWCSGLYDAQFSKSTTIIGAAAQ